MATSHKGTAIVTGATGGIGGAISRRLAEDGFNVALADLHATKDKLHALAEEIKQATGRRTLAVPVNVTVESEVRDLVDLVARELGGVDVVSCV